MEDADLVCRACGVVDDEKRELLERLQVKEAMLFNHQKEIVQLRGRIKRLMGEQSDRRRTGPLGEDCRALFDYWRLRVEPKAREFNEARFNAVHARLNAGATVDEIMEAIDGAAARPYVTERGRQPHGEAKDRHVDLELICRSEQHLNKFRSLAPKPVQETPAGNLDNLSEASRAGATAAAERVAMSDLEAQMATYQRALSDAVMTRLMELRHWSMETMLELELGIDNKRVVFGSRDAEGNLCGFVRYAPNPEQRHGPKSLAEGERQLFPRPEMYRDGGIIWLVEGEGDAVALRSCGFQVTSVPGVGTWKPGWANRFEPFERVIICFDCDGQGRDAADKRARAIGQLGIPVTVVDLDLGRSDAYDISDLIHEEGRHRAANFLWGKAKEDGRSVIKMPTPKPSHRPVVRAGDPLETFLTAMSDAGLRISGSLPHLSGQCPAHEDRHASMSISLGADKLLVKCHAGCDTGDIIRALRLEWADLFIEETG